MHEKLGLIRWRNYTIDLEALARAEPKLWEKELHRLVSCYLAYVDALQEAADNQPWSYDRPPLDAIDYIHDELFRVFRQVFPEEYADHERMETLRRQVASQIKPDKKPVPRGLRRAVFERDDFRCKRCGERFDLCADHVVPECQGGPTTLENLQTLCRPCNARKGSKLP